MDHSGFDDLLSSSRNVTLDNPFENPFATHRSSSPDPWASFGTSQPSTAAQDGNSEGEVFAVTHTAAASSDLTGFGSAAGFGAYDPDGASATTYAAEAEDTDVLSPTHTTSEPQTPGFRESISVENGTVTSPTMDTEQPEPLPLVPEPAPPSSPPEPLRISQITQSDAPINRFETSPASPTSAGPVSQASRPEPSFRSPLEQPLPRAFEQSFAGLSIGGESLGGWQESQNGFGNGSRSEVASPQRGPSNSDDDDDDDDDRPIAQVMREGSRPPIARISPPVAAVRTENGLQPVFVISVDDPQRVGDAIRAYTMYTVHTKTTSPMFSKSSFSVLRRYSDFLWLYETLSMNNPGVVVPPVPEKSPFGRFDQQFVQQRRRELEKCIQKIASHPVLQKDTDLKLFLESDTFALDIKHRKAEIAHEKGGLMSSIGQSLAGPRFHEPDEWFDRQKAYLDSLETQLRGLVKAVDMVTKQRTELAVSAGEFSQTVQDLAQSDVGKQLQSAFAGLADVERKAQDLQNAQSQADVVTIMSTVDEYARLINSVRMAFSSRVRTYYAWQSADSNLKRVKQAHDTNRAQGRIPADQISRSLAQVAEAERRAMEAKQEFDSVSRLVKSEVARFEQERIEDFKSSLEAFLDGMISRQRQLIAAWEHYQQTLLKKPATSQPHSSTDAPIAVA